MKTIIFYTKDRDEAIRSVEFLTKDIQSREDASHQLYFRFLMAGAYSVARGTTDEKGNKELTGEHEIIFIPFNRQRDIERLKELKEVIWYKNAMIIAGNGEKPTELRRLLINWLLNDKEEFVNEKD